MQAKPSGTHQTSFLMPTLGEQLDPRQPLKQLFNQGDETVVAAWVQNPYWQYFCGMNEFQWQVPCDPSDLVYFRQRIGEAGVQRLLQASVQLHGPGAQEKEVVVDTTVQEKNITHPTDTKL